MAVSYFPFNSIVVDGVADRPANAENLAAYLAAYFSNGVLMQTDTALQVVVGSGMNVQIKAGAGCVNGKTILNTAAETLSIEAASATQDRIDRVIFRLDESNRLIEFDVLKGTPSSSPSAPALTRSEGVYEMCLAEIRVPAGASSIIASYITDTRANASLCGYSKTSTFEGVSIDKLWENASPTSNFASQTISLNLTDYDFIIVVFRYSIASNKYISAMAPINHDGVGNQVFGSFAIGEGGAMLAHWRQTSEVSDTKITFMDGYKSTANSNAVDNSYCIPVEIFGGKGVK
ncbi:MAG: hypothetical protein ACI4S2_12335 [Lachnospiraceae bacterium]